MEIGCIDNSGRDPLYLAAEVFELARSFSARGGRVAVRHGGYLACVQKSTSNVDGVAQERRDGITYSESMQISNFVPQTIKSIYFLIF